MYKLNHKPINISSAKRLSDICSFKVVCVKNVILCLSRLSHKMLHNQNKKALIARIQKADSFVHMQDMPETDILLSSDYAAHEGGFAAAKAEIGGEANLYHLDNRHDKHSTLVQYLQKNNLSIDFEEDKKERNVFEKFRLILIS